MTVVRLIIRPCPITTGKHADKFDTYLDGHYIVTSREPLLDGARELLRRGHDPATLLTTRHACKAFDSFEPLPIGKLAGLMIGEGDKRGLSLRKWESRTRMPFPLGRGRRQRALRLSRWLRHPPN